MKIIKAVFAGSSTKTDNKPKQKLPEFAFIGRSNVGKSSLINMLCGGAQKLDGTKERKTVLKELARTSASPGKTVLVNHFLIDGNWYLVDLPGYGFAKLPKTQRDALAKMNNDYINKSEELVNLFVLIDSRHALQDMDLSFMQSLGKAHIPFAVIFTKADKMGKEAVRKSVGDIKKEMLEYWEELPPCFVSSAEKGTGKEEILRYIGEILNSIKNK